MVQVLAVKELHWATLLQEAEVVVELIRVAWSIQKGEDHKMLLADKVLHHRLLRHHLNPIPPSGTKLLSEPERLVPLTQCQVRRELDDQLKDPRGEVK